MRKIDLIQFVILPIIFLQFSACSSSNQPNIKETVFTNENKPTGKPRTVGDENFAKEQKEKLEAVTAELERNRQLWREGNSNNYDFVCEQTAQVLRAWSPALMKVREGKNVAIKPAAKSDTSNLNALDGYEKFDTVEKVFDYIKQQLDNGSQVIVKYDKKFGYPKDILVMYSYAIDHHSGVRITKFETVK